jgi:ABC-type transport system involved in multi-copper enzyme maturation permease subunit
MNPVIKAELRKLRYTTTFPLTLLGATFLAVLSALPATYAMVKIGKNVYGQASLMDPQVINGIYAKATSGYIFALILGITLMAGEFQSGMAVITFLATPKRERVVAAKFLVAAVAGAIVMSVSVGFGSLAAWYGMRAYPHANPTSDLFVNLLISPLVSGAVLAIIGVAIGMLIRNVRIATTGSLVWMMIVERLIVVFWSTGGKWLPTGAIVGMFNLNLKLRSTSKALSFDSSNYFSPGISIVLLIGYALLFATMGRFISLRKDIH